MGGSNTTDGDIPPVGQKFLGGPTPLLAIMGGGPPGGLRATYKFFWRYERLKGFFGGGAPIRGP